jgi:type III restriction enzyme
LLTAIDALYGHYEKTFDAWKQAGIGVDPVFILVCNNTATSKLVHDYIAGYEVDTPHGGKMTMAGKCGLFQNFDPDGIALPRMRTLLIDSTQVDSGEAISSEFREAARDEIERFKRTDPAQRRSRGGREDRRQRDPARSAQHSGRGPVGEGIRCVVSVSMLTEGWTPTPSPTCWACARSVRNCCVNR